MVKDERVGKRERWKTTEDLPGEKTYRDLLARERDGSPLSIFQGNQLDSVKFPRLTPKV